MATRETGIAVAIIGAAGVILAACISTGTYEAFCPESFCGTGSADTATRSPGGNSDRSTDRCIQGYVWREAVADDHVCVPPATRDEARRDNELAGSRRSPNGGPSGPDTCIDGYVWREATPSDHVCVTPETRSRTANDNELADTRRMH